MILNVQDKSVSAKMGDYYATAVARTCEDGVIGGWAVHAWNGDRQMVSAWCQLDRHDAVRACKLLVRWLANMTAMEGRAAK